METKTFPAFGFYVIRNKILAGEVITDDVFFNGLVEIKDGFDYCWLYTKGLVHNVCTATQEVSARAPGFCNAVTKEKPGVWRADFLQDSVVFCVPPQDNTTNPLAPKLIDVITPFVLQAGQTVTLPRGTKLSLCQGSISINGTTIPEMKQVEMKNGDRQVTAIEDAYGLIFP
jgi:hypothetical protein